MICFLVHSTAEAWRQRDAAQAREQTAQETMYHMRDKLDVFQKEKDKYAGSGDAEQYIHIILKMFVP